MRGGYYILIFLVSLASEARAELGLGSSSGASKPKPKPPTSYRTQQQDEAYKNRVTEIETGYKQQTDAVNDGKYENYLGKLDTTYDAMVNDINKGGSGRIAGELPKFVPTKVPSGTASGSATTGAHSTGTSASTTSSDAKAMLPPQVAAAFDYCSKACTGFTEGLNQVCMAGCAHGAASVQQQAQTAQAAQLIFLLSALRGI